MTISTTELQELTYQAYEQTRASAQLGSAYDMSSSDLCSRLTTNLQAGLFERGHESRRELHMTKNGIWHFVIAHAAPDAEPTSDDIISDLNPWQFIPDRPVIGALHAPREMVAERLRIEGAPEYFVSLRGLATIIDKHTRIRRPSLRQTRAA